MHHRRIFFFTYPPSMRFGRVRMRGQLRDSTAALVINQALAGRGFRYYGAICNFPHREPNIKFDPKDLILITTRLPLDDPPSPRRKRVIHRSFTKLEEKIFQALRPIFAHCSRRQIRLTDEIAKLSSAIAAKQVLEFQVNGGAKIISAGPDARGNFIEPSRSISAGYLVYLRHAWPGGPALLAAFSVGGMETFVWASVLASKCRAHLCSTPFLMGEIPTAGLPKQPATDEFAKEWPVKILAPKVTRRTGAVAGAKRRASNARLRGRALTEPPDFRGNDLPQKEVRKKGANRRRRPIRAAHAIPLDLQKHRA